MIAATPALPTLGDYSELRQHELRKSRMVMIDGNLSVNSASTEAGISARVLDGGYWGFAAVPGMNLSRVRQVEEKARINAKAIWMMRRENQ
jgi:TldD protein